MAELVYSAVTSLAFVDDPERLVGTSLYRRRMYEVMRLREDPPALAATPSAVTAPGSPGSRCSP